MSVDTIAPIESSVHATNEWIKELNIELGWHDRQRAYHALRAVLHALRDRLTVAEAVELGAQLPMVIRGMYFEGWRPTGKPTKERRKEQFLAHIAAEFNHNPDVFPEAVAWSVFKLLQNHVSMGELADVQHVLPADLRKLWPTAVA
jgi:uncharacterized protein (DUF2267 family)